MNRAPPTDSRGALREYERIRERLPLARFGASTEFLPDLGPLQDRFEAFVFDGFGVLNIGPRPIPGAAARIRSLRAAGRLVRVLTNASTDPALDQAGRYRRLGFDFTANEIISSRGILARHLAELAQPGHWGLVLPAGPSVRDLPTGRRLGSVAAAQWDRLAGFVLLSTRDWDPALQARIVDSLAQRARPLLVGNPDLVAPYPHGLSLEPGYFAHRIADQTGIAPEFFGKPFANAFQAVRASLPCGLDPRRVLMLGDSPHTDILGAAAAGLASALVSGHGLLRDLDARGVIDETGIVPDFVLPAI